MRTRHWVSARLYQGIGLALVLAFSGAWIARAQAKIEATIFAYDGKDFVRTKTTLMTEKGESAVNTKLEHDTPAYKALIKKHSYVGDVTLFGRKYQADYAPLTGDDGRLTGALFVAVAE